MKGVKCGTDCLNCPLPQCKHDVVEVKAKKKQPEKPKDYHKPGYNKAYYAAHAEELKEKARKRYRRRVYG